MNVHWIRSTDDCVLVRDPSTWSSAFLLGRAEESIRPSEVKGTGKRSIVYTNFRTMNGPRYHPRFLRRFGDICPGTRGRRITVHLICPIFHSFNFSSYFSLCRTLFPVRRSGCPTTLSVGRLSLNQSPTVDYFRGLGIPCHPWSDPGIRGNLSQPGFTVSLFTGCVGPYRTSVRSRSR